LATAVIEFITGSSLIAGLGEPDVAGDGVPTGLERGFRPRRGRPRSRCGAGAALVLALGAVDDIQVAAGAARAIQQKPRLRWEMHGTSSGSMVMAALPTAATEHEGARVCAERGIAPQVEPIRADAVNEAYERVLACDVRTPEVPPSAMKDLVEAFDQIAGSRGPTSCSGQSRSRPGRRRAAGSAWRRRPTRWRR